MVPRPLGYWRVLDGRIAFVSEIVINRGLIGGEILGQLTPYGEQGTIQCVWKQPDLGSIRLRFPEFWDTPPAAEMPLWLYAGPLFFGSLDLVEYLGPLLKQEWFKLPPEVKGCCCGSV